MTASDVAHDLRELTPAECAERGIRHSSEDDQSTAIFPGDNQHIRRMELCYSTNRAFRKESL